MKAPKKWMWAIISNRGIIRDVFHNKAAARYGFMFWTDKDRATHYIARVEVSEVKK